MIQIKQGEIVIHTSDRSMFRRCRRKALHASKLWKGLQPVRPNSILWLGTGVHKALEDYYAFQHDLVTTFTTWADEKLEELKRKQGMLPEERAKFQETIDLGVGILDHYSKFAKEYDDFNTYILPDGSPAVEVMFKVPINHPGTEEQLHARFVVVQKGMTVDQQDHLSVNGFVDIPVFYGGRFDHIAEDSFGNLWVVDHKTCKSFGDWDKLPLDTQCGSYIWAAEKTLPLHKHLSGVIYNGLKKTVPEQPELLKKGGLSKNKNQNTTYELYLNAIEENGLDVFAYEDILDTLKARDKHTASLIETKYFRRQTVKRSRAEVKNIALDIYHEAIEMLQATDTSFYPNPTKDCTWDCDFYEVCRGLYNDEDVDYMLESMYEKRAEETDEFSVLARQEEQ